MPGSFGSSMTLPGIVLMAVIVIALWWSGRKSKR